ncbi:MAG TPA: hypothetical protein VFC46_09950, partial [Humisphaera sp.]|nr:hypothetical protein [Humisphaera sp.]
DLARSRGLLKEAFAKQLKDRSAVGRKKLAQALLDEVPKAADNPTDQYVLLGGAIEASKDAAVLPLCFQAADMMARQYDVDALNVKTEAALKMNLRGDSPATAAENVKAALELIDPLLDAEDFSTATRILALARPAATGDPFLASVVQKRIQAVETLRTAHDRFTQQLQRLKSAPDDPAANLAVGSYLCFYKGEWDKGLPMLVKGSDANLKQVAEIDVARPTSTEDVMRLGDRWWDLAAKQPDAIRGEIQLHAASFYKVALENSSGLRRTLMERRIADAGAEHAASLRPTHARMIDLLALIDIQRDAVNGKWTLDRGVLSGSGPGNGLRIILPYEPPDEYDFLMEFEETAVSNAVVQIVATNKARFMWFMGADDNTAYGIGIVDPKSGHANTASGTIKNMITSHKRHISIVSVRRNRISATLDGRELAYYDTDFSDVHIQDFWSIGSGPCLGLGSSHPVSVYRAELNEIAGVGRRIYPTTP